MLKNTVAPLSSDEYLKPFWPLIEKRHADYIRVKSRLTRNGEFSLRNFALADQYFGLHQQPQSWIFREFAPNAEEIYLIGDFSNWQKSEAFRLQRINAHGEWKIELPLATIQHGMNYKLLLKFDGVYHERLAAYSNYVVQNPDNKIFSSQVWAPKAPYQFKYDNIHKGDDDSLLIYECHIGMASNDEKVATYREFKDNILPQIAKSNYNTIQIMAIMSHPYYGSFGYHVANFFSISSNFGTPDDFKELVDEAHRLKLRVIIDLVHSHAVKNEVEGLAKFDGTRYLYFHNGARGEHGAWDSLCFNYAKDEVLHFLLSN